LRSFDRIPLTQQLLDQEQKSGVDVIKADIALDLNLNGIDRLKDDNVTVSHLGNGDSMDCVAHHHAGPSQNHKETKLGDMFSWTDKTNQDAKYNQLNQVLSAYDGAATKSQVSGTVAEQGMMTGQNVYDQTWTGNSADAVKNFVTEELYIHTKVYLASAYLLIIAHDC
jgi:hypothetical protein